MLEILFILVFLGLALFGVLSFWNSGYCLGIVWSSFALEQLFQYRYPYFVDNGSVFNYAVAGFVGLNCLVMAFRGKIKINKFPLQGLFFVAMIGLCSLSYFWSVDPDTTMEYLQSAFPYICVFGLAAPFCVQTNRELTAMVRTIVFFGSLVLFAHAFTEIRQRMIWVDIGGGKLQHLNPLAIASLSGHVVCCTAFWIYFSKRGSQLRTFIAIFVIATAVFLAIRSGSRGQTIGLVLMVAFWLPITARMALKKLSVTALLGTVAIAVGAIITIDQMGWMTSWQMDNIREAFEGRVQLSMTALEWYLRGDVFQWLFGYGSSASWKLMGGFPHNLPVEVLMEQGLVGLSFLTIFVFSVFSPGIRLMKSDQLEQSARVGVGLMLCLFSFEVFISLKQGTFVDSSVFFGLGITAMMYFQHVQRQMGRSSIRIMPASYQTGFRTMTARR